MPNDHSMKDKFLAEVASVNDDAEEAATAFRNVGQAPMLHLRLKNGEEFAAPYPYMAWADYKPENGITLEFPTRHVVIRGQALSHLFRQIAEHKRAMVEELTAPSRRIAMHENRSRVTEILIIKPKKAKEEEGEDDTRNADNVDR